MTTLRLAFAVFVFSVAPVSARAQATQPAPQPPAKRLTLSPAPAPEPALRYRFSPDRREIENRNAAVYYLTGMTLTESIQATHEQTEELLATPLAELNAAKFETVRLPAHVRRQLELGAQSEWADWQTPLEEDGIATILPPLGSLRRMARLLDTEARVQMAQHEFGRATQTLGLGLTMAHHTGKGPTLIQGLVGISIATMMLERVEEFVQQPDAPNLYWALTALPDPIVEADALLRSEWWGWDRVVERLAPLERKALTEQAVEAYADDLAAFVATMSGDSARGPMSDEELQRHRQIAAALVIARYPRARDFLVAQGREVEEVEAMPATQVWLIYELGRYRYWRDRHHKWTYLPYWQSQRELRSVEEHELRAASDESEAIVLAIVPGLSGGRTASMVVARRIAALRVVEALRMHAAAHGELPASLDEIDMVPAPLDPMTNEPFRYQLDRGVATLASPPSEGESERNDVRYEIVLAPAAADAGPTGESR